MVRILAPQQTSPFKNSTLVEAATVMGMEYICKIQTPQISRTHFLTITITQSTSTLMVQLLTTQQSPTITMVCSKAQSTSFNQMVITLLTTI